MRTLFSRYNTLSHRQKGITWIILFSLLFIPGFGLFWWIPFSLLVGMQAYISFQKRNANMVGGIATGLGMVVLGFLIGAVPITFANPSFSEPAKEESVVDVEYIQETEAVVTEEESEEEEVIIEEVIEPEPSVQEEKPVVVPVKQAPVPVAQPVAPQPTVVPVVPEPAPIVVEPIPVAPPAPTPVPVAAPVQKEVPAPATGGFIDGTCAYLRTLGLGNFTPGDPNYLPRRDRDGDGIACEM